MVSYPGQRPFNWPAALLLGGSLCLMGALTFGGGAEVISSFRRALPETPLAWWPEMSRVGFALLAGPFLLGAVAMVIMPRVEWSKRVGSALVSIGGVLAAAGVVWDAGSGVAIYDDRIIHKTAGIDSVMQTEMLADARRIETYCVINRGRGGSRRPEPGYVLVFNSGAVLELWSPGPGGGPDLPNGLKHIRIINGAAERAGAVRAPHRRPDGALIGDQGCLSLLADRLGMPIAQVEPLFRVHQRELRRGEYVVAPPET